MNVEYFDIQYKGEMHYPRGYRHSMPQSPHYFQDEILAEVSKHPPSERKRILRAMKDAIRKGEPWRDIA